MFWGRVSSDAGDALRCSPVDAVHVVAVLLGQDGGAPPAGLRGGSGREQSRGSSRKRKRSLCTEILVKKQSKPLLGQHDTGRRLHSDVYS